MKTSVHLTDLPVGPLAHIASFLPVPSRALFAISLDKVNKQDVARIVGEDLHTIDFGHIEKHLAEKLSDNHIESILRCIDAGHKVVELRLTNCRKISGAGLAPLCGSAVVDHIDLSINGDNEFAAISPEPQISFNAVAPILSSIVEAENGALILLQFPNKWRRQRIFSSSFHQFLLRYRTFLSSKNIDHCVTCEEAKDGDDICVGLGSLYYGLQIARCYSCLRSAYFCESCEEERSHNDLIVCTVCERVYCRQCCSTRCCLRCSTEFCVECFPPAPQVFCIRCGCRIICCGCITNTETARCNFCEVTYVTSTS